MKRTLENKRKRIWKKILLFIGAFIILIAGYLVWQINDIVITEIDYQNKKIPASFDGFKIVQVSDLHNKRFGKNQNRLIKNIESCEPDVILVTGDIIDRRNYDLNIALEFINNAKEIAPIYFVSGNHEVWSYKYEAIKKALVDAGVIFLDHDKKEIEINGEKISIAGLADPSLLTTEYMEKMNLDTTEAALEKLSAGDEFEILLSHRPELIHLYSQNKVDLVFTGHAHGGQVRIPFIGALIAPDQGLFPKYTKGSYKEDETTMVVSRGLGNSIIPIRIFNRPEIIFVELKN